MIHKFNKENWWGDETSINVRQSDSSFMHYDDRYFLKMTKPVVLDDGSTYESGELFRENETSYPVVSISRFGDERWTAVDGNEPEYVNVSRCNANPHVACAMILHNVV